MQNLKLLFFSLCFIICVTTKAQSPNSLNSGSSYSSTATSVKHKKKNKVHFFSPSREKDYRKPNVKHTARYEYYERMEQVAKEKQRMLKELSKPQYSDPRYFGHTKIPKRRKPSKMRYCTECGIRH